MKRLTSCASAAVATALFALSPTSANAGNFKSDFLRLATPPKVAEEAGFNTSQAARMEVVGISMVVRVPTGVAGEYEVGIVNFKSDDTFQGGGFGRGQGRDSDRAAMSAEQDSVGARYVSIPKEECQQPDEPVLSIGEEYNYIVQWCKKHGSSSPRSAKKNYYQMLSNGDFYFAATLRFDCNNANDLALMPQVVINGSC